MQRMGQIAIMSKGVGHTFNHLINIRINIRINNLISNLIAIGSNGSRWGSGSTCIFQSIERKRRGRRACARARALGKQRRHNINTVRDWYLSLRRCPTTKLIIDAIRDWHQVMPPSMLSKTGFNLWRVRFAGDTAHLALRLVPVLVRCRRNFVCPDAFRSHA